MSVTFIPADGELGKTPSFGMNNDDARSFFQLLGMTDADGMGCIGADLMVERIVKRFGDLRAAEQIPRSHGWRAAKVLEVARRASQAPAGLLQWF